MPNGGILEVSGKIQNDYMEISFTDQGIGISEEIKQKIFYRCLRLKLKVWVLA